MKILLLALLFVLGCTPRVFYATGTPNAAERAEEMSVALLDDDAAKCGGVWVAQDKILTAYHCVEDNGNAAAPLLEALGVEVPPWNPVGQLQKIQISNKETYTSVVDAIDVKNDLALLRAVLVPAHAVAKVRLWTMHVGQPLDIVGSTGGLAFSYTHGYVGALDRRLEDMDGTYLQVAGPAIYFGNSGGGAFDDQGDLVGIADAMNKGSRLVFFIPQTTIREFLHAHSS